MAERHADRAHATWSASASERLWGCPGSLALSLRSDIPDKESHAAAWGTAAHEVAETCLGGNLDAASQIGRIVKTKAFEIEVDDEIAECAQEYVDYVREQADGCDLLIEQKFDLAGLDPPFWAGGTGDAVILDEANRRIEVVDLKGGRGIVVEAKGNKQLRTYGLGAYMANPGDWQTVKVTIVQPRAPHKDGRIRSEEFDVIDLVDWTTDLLGAMDIAETAKARLDDTPREAWSEHYLRAGDHCTFCPVKVGCPALEAKALAVAQTHFNDETGQLAKPPAPDTLSMDQIVRVLDAADMIQGWLNAVRAYAQDQAELGIEVSSGDSVYGLTEKRGIRKFPGDAADVAKELADRTFRPVEDFYAEPKLMSPAQVEKLLGKKDAKAALDGLVEQKSSGYNLTRLDKTNREAVPAPPQQFFKNEKE